MTKSTARTTTWTGTPWRSLDELAAVRAFASGTLLVTGATGFLGGHFLYWWHRSGGNAAAVMRASDDRSAHRRLWLRQREVASAYSHAPTSELGRIEAVRGDARLPLFGLTAPNLNSLREKNVEAVWHFAASLRFEQGQSSELMAENVGGTRNAMAVAKAVGARRFVYVSTAYSCGAVEGRIAEGLHSLAAPFNNPYEESKCRAEHLVMSGSPSLGLQPIILRPSIVVGPSTTWQTGGSESGLYGLLNRLRRLSSLPHDRVPRLINLAGRSDAQLDLVPVDAVIRDCLNLAASDFPGGPIHHLTSPDGPTIGEAAVIASEYLGLPPIRLGEPEGNLSHLEKWLDRQLRIYLPYLHFGGGFVRSLPEPIRIGTDDLRNLIANYVRTHPAPARAALANRSSLSPSNLLS